MYLLLCDVFGKDDVEVQYDKDKRYPFLCDFYIKSLDLFMELNASWTHGGHWFDENDPLDVEKVMGWAEKAKEKGSRYYHTAIYMWTHRDLLKRKTARDNNINYVVFWDNDLTDARAWLKQYR